MESMSQYQNATSRATPPNATNNRKQSNNMVSPLRAVSRDRKLRYTMFHRCQAVGASTPGARAAVNVIPRGNMARTVIVTGALGRVGLRTVSHLLAAGHHVIALDLKTRRSAVKAAKFGSGVEVAWADIRDASIWPGLLSRADAVVHLAAVIPPLANRQPELATAVNRTATLDLVQAMESASRAKRLVFASSTVVAGQRQHLRAPPLRAEEPPAPGDHYGRTKVAAEEAIGGSTLHWTILRLAPVVPPRLGLDYAGNIDAMFDASPDGRFEAVAEDDAGLACANAVDCDAAIGRILLIGGGPSCRATIMDFYNRFLDCAGIGPMSPSCLRAGGPYFAGDWLDTQESQRLLRFQRHDLEDMLASIRAGIGPLRYPARMLAPVINRLLARRSPHRGHV